MDFSRNFNGDSLRYFFQNSCSIFSMISLKFFLERLTEVPSRNSVKKSRIPFGMAPRFPLELYLKSKFSGISLSGAPSGIKEIVGRITASVKNNKYKELKKFFNFLRIFRENFLGKPRLNSLSNHCGNCLGYL